MSQPYVIMLLQWNKDSNVPLLSAKEANNKCGAKYKETKLCHAFGLRVIEAHRNHETGSRNQIMAQFLPKTNLVWTSHHKLISAQFWKKMMSHKKCLFKMTNTLEIPQSALKQYMNCWEVLQHCWLSKTQRPFQTPKRFEIWLSFEKWNDRLLLSSNSHYPFQGTSVDMLSGVRLMRIYLWLLSPNICLCLTR